MRSQLVALTLTLSTGVIFAVASCAAGTASVGPDGGCSLGETQECQAAAHCIGGQVCDNAGNWSACVCENDAGVIDIDGAYIPISGGGVGGDAGGGGFGGAGGASGTSGSGGKGTTGVGGSFGVGGSASSGGSGHGGKGGSAGTGGGGSKGGSGVKSGPGGSSGSGAGGSSGYAYVVVPREEHHSAVKLSAGASETPFVWHDAPGLAPPADLWVEAAGKTVLQVSSVGRHPFARAGLDVVPIERDVPYRILIEQSDEAVDVTVLRDGREASTVLHTRLHVADKRTASITPAADIVFPTRPWRASISAE